MAMTAQRLHARTVFDRFMFAGTPSSVVLRISQKNRVQTFKGASASGRLRHASQQHDGCGAVPAPGNGPGSPQQVASRHLPTHTLASTLNSCALLPSPLRRSSMTPTTMQQGIAWPQYELARPQHGNAADPPPHHHNRGAAHHVAVCHAVCRTCCRTLRAPRPLRGIINQSNKSPHSCAVHTVGWRSAMRASSHDNESPLPSRG